MNLTEYVDGFLYLQMPMPPIPSTPPATHVPKCPWACWRPRRPPTSNPQAAQAPVSGTGLKSTAALATGETVAMAAAGGNAATVRRRIGFGPIQIVGWTQESSIEIRTNKDSSLTVSCVKTYRGGNSNLNRGHGRTAPPPRAAAGSHLRRSRVLKPEASTSQCWHTLRCQLIRFVFAPFYSIYWSHVNKSLMCFSINCTIII